MTILSTDLQPHPLGELFPLIEGPEFDALVADIRKHGKLLFPITTYEGQILDGRNRYRACRAANVEPKFESYAGDDPTGFVLSANIARRHLAPEQKRELIRKVLQLKPELSNRQIGEQTQASHPFVGKVRGEMEQAGQLETATRTACRSSGLGARRTWLITAPFFCDSPVKSSTVQPLPSRCAAMPSSAPTVITPVPPMPVTRMS